MSEQLNRRRFIADLGRGVFAIALFGSGVVACASSDTEDTPAPNGTAGDETSTTSQGPATTSAEGSTTSSTRSLGGFTVARVDLGFVSAYALVRSGEVVLVDTGNPNNESDIEEVLSEVGLGWSNVGHVIVTHLHGDHQGSLPAVLEAAVEAEVYSGELDIPGINSPRPLTPVGDGDDVEGLQIIWTPGHTPGHISVYDPLGGALMAGDSMNGQGSDVDGADTGLGGANPRFTADMDEADRSIRKMAPLRPTAIYFGHGEPLLVDAGSKLAELAASL
jgi:glyoxylase-like metal-dependent hydrolase (beta-lactamase superfamily II)